MWYRRLRTGALFMFIVLFVLLSYSIRNTPPQPVANINSAILTIEVFTRSVSAVNSIEYKHTIKNTGMDNNKSSVEMHYYYKRPGNLRVEIKKQDSISIDIYNPNGVYEYSSKSNTAYFREKWKDDKPLSFQLEDKLQDIIIRGKYEPYKFDKFNDINCEVIRSVDDDGKEIYEHRVWLAQKDSLKLPIKEEYLIDGEISSTHEYEYISINKEIDNSTFELKPSDKLKIISAEGIPKLVKDEKEAEKYVKFDVVIPEYKPKGFVLKEIHVIPPVKTPSALICYMLDDNMIYLNQKSIRKNELSTSNSDKIIAVGSKKFAVTKYSDNMLAVRWIKDGIEFEASGNDEYKGEIIKLIHSLTNLWISF